MACNCITNGDYIAAAEKQASAIKTQAYTETAINVALALWQRNTSKSIASMQHSIAKRNLRLSQELYNHAIKFWPCQKELVAEVFGNGLAPIQSEALANQYSGFGRKALNDGEDAWRREAKRHCIQITACDDARWARFAAASDADLISFGDRQAEARAQSLNDVRYSRMVAALGLGKGLVTNIESFSNVHGAAGMSAATLLGGAINSATSAIGFHLRRDRTQRWDGVVGNNRLPMEAKQETPKGYEVIIGTVKDEPIEVGCIEPSEYDKRNRTQAYKDYLVCKGLAK